MRISRIYQAGQYSMGHVYTLDDAASHYIAHVLRLQEQDRIHIFNDKDLAYEAIIRRIERHKVNIEIISPLASLSESPCRITLFQGIAKQEAMDIAIQKSVELGVHAITPVITARTQGFRGTLHGDKKILHWQRIIISAAEQSGRTTLPKLHPPIPFENIAFNTLPSLPLLLDPASSNTFHTLPEKAQTVSLFIGPEGGFTSEEVSLAISQRVMTLTCGPRILRTETASITAITLLQHRFGDL